MNPLVSILIPCYNCEKYLDNCIKDLLNQTYQNFEIIIVDDCSTDRSAEIIKHYSEIDNRVRYYVNKQNMLEPSTRNKTIEKSKGKFLMLQDADDRCEKDRIEKLLNFLLKNDDIDFVSSGFYLFNNDRQYKVVTPKIFLPSKNSFLFGSPFCHAATMFRSDCIKKINGYRVSKETRRGSDYDLFMRLYAEGFKGANIELILYGYRVDYNTLKRRKFKYRFDEFVIRYKGFKKLKLFPIGFIYLFKPFIAYFLQIFKKS